MSVNEYKKFETVSMGIYRNDVWMRLNLECNTILFDRWAYMLITACSKKT